MNKVRIWEIVVFVVCLATAFWFFHQFGGAPATKEVVDGRYFIQPKGKWQSREISAQLYYSYMVFEWFFVPYFIYFLWKYFEIIRNSIRDDN